MQTPTNATGQPVQQPRRMTMAEKFLLLMEQRERTERRLAALLRTMNLREPLLFDAADFVLPALPKSGLRLVASAPGSLTFKGGRAHG